MASVEKYSIPKLNGANYFNWKFRIEMLLKEKDLWKQISDAVPDPVTDTWTRADEKAMATIAMTIDDTQIQHVRDCASAGAAWKALKDFHEKDSAGSRVRILRQIMGARADENTNIEEHVQKVTEQFQKLLSFDKQIKVEFLMAATLLCSLPSSYDSLITALEARKEDELTSSLVRSKIVEEYRRRMDRDGVASDAAALKVTRRNDYYCSHCNKHGHSNSHCRKLKDKGKGKQKNKNDDRSNNNKANMIGQLSNDVLFAVGKIDGFILDSGASCHVSCDKSIFIDLDMSHHDKVFVANGNEVTSSGRGNIRVVFQNENGESTKVTLCDVLFVPSFGGNLISVKKLAQKGFMVNFKAEKCEISYPNGKQIAIGDIQNGLYKMRQPQSACFVNNKAKLCAHDWHRILGHRDMRVIKSLSSSELVDGFHMAKCSANCPSSAECEACITGKMKRLSFPKESKNRATAPLELIHTDVCGPMATQTPGHRRYILTFIDDFSRHCTVYLLANKSDVFAAFKNYFELTRNKFGTSIKKIRSDRGGEYMLREFLAFLSENGIESQRTAPYSAQQNGVAERKNRSLMEMARSMLSDAKLPDTYWGEAVVTANFIQNHLPCTSVDRTPFELWHQRKPFYGNLRRFGAKCFIRIPDEHRRKLDPKAEMAILLGFDTESKAYKCLVPEKNKVVISRDVIFCDDTLQTIAPSKVVKKSNSVIESFCEIDAISSIDEPDGAAQAEQNPQNASIADEPNVPDGAAQEQDVDNEIPPNDDTKGVRVSARSNKGIPPKRLIEEVSLVSECGWLVVDGEPKTYNDAMKRDDKEEWKTAMRKEMRSLTDNGTWDLVELPSGRTAIGCRWVYKIKTNSEAPLYKARLVAQGFSQKFGSDYDEVFAPVARHATIKLLLSSAASKNMSVTHYDAKSAFLNGELQETIYMKQPPGFVKEGMDDHVCLLKKSIYGLKQSARVWNQMLHMFFIKLGLRQSEHDPCLYVYMENGKCIFVIIHVDDIIMATNGTSLRTHVEAQLERIFDINNLGNVASYLGIRIIREDQYFLLDQEKYINSLVSEFGLNVAKPADTPMSDSFLKENESNFLLTNSDYRKAIGCLLFVAINTRPDISAAVTILAQRVEKPTQRDWDEVKRVIKFLKATAANKLRLGFTGDTALIGYADADYAEDRDTRKSNTGFVFLFGGPISWACRKQTCVALSSTEAEVIALSEAAKECIWLRDVLRDFGVNVQGPTIIHEDNQSCIKIFENEKFNLRTKHIDVKAHHIQDIMKKNVIDIVYCPSDNNIADLLTKPLPKKKFELLKAKFNLK